MPSGETWRSIDTTPGRSMSSILACCEIKENSEGGFDESEMQWRQEK